MKSQNRWLLGLGVIMAAGIALWAGVALGTLLLVGALLLCPASMYFGMQGMQPGGCGHGAKCEHGDQPNAKSEVGMNKRPKAAA